MPRRRTNDREQVRAEQFAHALSNILHELHISHRDLAAALNISRYTVDSWTRMSDPALPSEQNLGMTQEQAIEIITHLRMNTGRMFD